MIERHDVLRAKGSPFGRIGVLSDVPLRATRNCRRKTKGLIDACIKVAHFLEVFARYHFPGRIKAINFLSQFSELLRAAKKVEEERGEDSLRGIGTRNNNKVTIVDNNFEWYFLFFSTEFVGLYKRSASDRGPGGD